MKKLILMLVMLVFLIGCGESRADREYVESMPTYKVHKFVNPENGFKRYLRAYCVDGYEFLSQYDDTLIQVYEAGKQGGRPQPKRCTRGR